MTTPSSSPSPASTLSEDAVDVHGLSVTYRNRIALDGLDLHLGLGVHALLGPNGAGKTTLMRVLATIAKPSAGKLTLFGQDPRDTKSVRSIRRQLGYLPQDFGYYPRFTVAEFVEYFAWLKEMPKESIGLAVDRALTRVGLADRAGEKMRSLSGGMRRRAGIAQAIVNDPALLLLDEPTAGLDPEVRVEFREMLRELGRDTCVVVSTHLVEDVAAACDSVLLLSGGHAVWTGHPDQMAALAGDSAGDSAIERGYTTLLRDHRAPR